MRGWGLFFFLLLLLLILGAIGWVVFTQIRARRSGLPAPSWRSYLPFLGRGGGGPLSNQPSPRSSNPLEWIRDKISDLRHGRNRTAEGHYEGAGGYAGSTSVGEPHPYRGAGDRRTRAMDPDEAWDTRVGNEADAYGATGPGGYYEEEEHELGLAPTPTRGLDKSYSNHPTPTDPPAYGEAADGRGRSRSRDTRYDQDSVGNQQQQRRGGGDPRNNPFSDEHEAASIRAGSPGLVVNPNVGGQQGIKAGKGGGGGGGSQENSPTERRSMFRESL